MKNKKIKIIVLIIILAVLLVPFNKKIYEDGGTKTYTSLTYKMIFWNELKECNPNARDGFQLVIFPNNFKSIDEF